jgi:hypothetical protein
MVPRVQQQRGAERARWQSSGMGAYGDGETWVPAGCMGFTLTGVGTGYFPQGAQC